MKLSNQIKLIFYERNSAIPDVLRLHWFRLKKDYVAAVEGIKKNLMKESEPNKLMFFGELLGGHSFSPKMVKKLFLTIVIKCRQFVLIE